MPRRNPIKTRTLARTAVLLPLFLSVVVLGASQGRLLSAQVPDNVLREFVPNGEYILVTNDKVTPAEIFKSGRAAAFLIISSALPSPVVLNSRINTAETVSLMKISKKPDGSIDLLSDAVLTPQSALDLGEETVAFTVAGRAFSLQLKPPLIGPRRTAEVTHHNPEYLISARNYAPNAPTIAALRKETRPIVVRTYYGSWCPHCRQMVPHILRVEQELKGANIRFEYWGVPHNFGTDAEAKKMSVSSVPTAVIFLNGKEIGRIINTDWESPETALARTLAIAPAAAAGPGRHARG